ncbi:MAG: PstS family phosphate ABC transporter substrate-binding protein [Planctomycetaceae bacterium]
MNRTSLLLLSAALVGAIGCRKRDDSTTVKIDGSSTVYPITQAVAVQFRKRNPKVSLEIGVSGTGGGFKKFLAGETDIHDASRPIKPSEIDEARKQNIEYIELTVAIDGLSVVVSRENDWCDALTVAQLKALWEPNSKVRKWSDLNPEWPAKTIKLYGPDTASGTFEYFTGVICGKKGASRSDYDRSADDNVLVTGVAGDKYALGYFGYSYYVENRDKLKALGIAKGDDVAAAVKPNETTIETGRYAPLSRPLFLYVNTKSLTRPEVAEFLRFYLAGGQEYVKRAKYIPLRKELYEQSRKTLEDAIRKARAE